MARRISLACGIVSAILYFAADIFMSIRYEGYSYLHRTVSELNAFGAPTRGLSIVLGLAGYVLLAAFGVGVWRSAAGNGKLRVVGGALAVMGFASLWAVPYAAMQMPGTKQEGPHVLTAFVGVLLLVTMIGFAAASFGRQFRLYSIATIVVMLLFGAWAGTYAGRVEEGLATPWVGIIERISFYSWHLWFIMLALRVLRPTEGQLASRQFQKRAA